MEADSSGESGRFDAETAFHHCRGACEYDDAFESLVRLPRSPATLRRRIVVTRRWARVDEEETRWRRVVVQEIRRILESSEEEMPSSEETVYAVSKS